MNYDAKEENIGAADGNTHIETTTKAASPLYLHFFRRPVIGRASCAKRTMNTAFRPVIRQQIGFIASYFALAAISTMGFLLIC